MSMLVGFRVAIATIAKNETVTELETETFVKTC